MKSVDFDVSFWLRLEHGGERVVKKAGKNGGFVGAVVDL